jgi:hypothetical protein
MSTLIIPAAGRSSRYPNMKAKWLLSHPTGDIMMQKVLESIDYKGFDRTIVTILREHCEKYEADVILEQVFGNSIEVLILDNPTKSPTETIYETIKQKKIEGTITIKDSDGIAKLPKNIKSKNFVAGLTIDSKSNVNHVQAKSFVIKNDDNIVHDIVEKEIASNIICVGQWQLSSEDFIDAYENIFNSLVYVKNNETYVSHIISYLIMKKNIIFEYAEAKDYVDWGTKKEWYQEIKDHTTYIFDIDGVFLKNCGKYGKKNWSNTFEPIQENIEFLKKLSKRNVEIIFMTPRPEESIAKFREYLNEQKINYKTIICNCNQARRILINDFSPSNPYPSCKSMSIKSNTLLTQYFD